MPRTPRSLLPDGTYHVTTHAIDKANLFRHVGDRRLYLSLLHDVVEQRDWVVLAFCLMGNHLHVLLESTVDDMSVGFWSLHKRFAERHNRTGHRGRLFNGRFYSKLVKTEHQRAATIRYIALNPVDAGFCPTPESWRWSSHGPLLGTTTAPPFLDVDRVHEIVGGPQGYAGLFLGPEPPEHEYLRRGEMPPLRLDPDVRAIATSGNDGDLIHLHRDLGMSYAELARCLGVHRSTVKRRIDATNG